VHNVGAGVAANDAVNLSQLQGVQTQLNNEINSLTSTVQANRIEAQRGIAGVSALNGIPALDQNSRFGLGVGVGTFHGQTAFAVGANFRFADHVTGKLAIGSASGETTGSAGIGVSF
jgi:autotransporter adhesin